MDKRQKWAVDRLQAIYERVYKTGLKDWSSEWAVLDGLGELREEIRTWELKEQECQEKKESQVS